MNLSQDPLFAVIKGQMKYLADRQGTATQNIANVNTPGYTAQEVVAPDFKQLIQSTTNRMEPVTTSPNHLKPMNRTGATYKLAEQKDNEVKPTGNNVDLQKELLSASQAQDTHRMMTQLYRKEMGLLRMAIRGSGQ